MTALPANLAAACDATCCAPTPRTMPWLRLAIGLFVAVQTMMIGLAVNLTPPDDLATRRLIDYAMLGATGVVILLLGGPLIADAFASLRRRRVSMELLFLAGIAGALGVSLQSMWAGAGPVYFDVVSVLLTVYSVGRAISRHSRQRANDAIASLRDIAPTARRVDPLAPSPGTPGEGWGEGSASFAGNFANHQNSHPFRSRDTGRGTEETVPASSIRVGDLVRVNPGELVPVDGVIVAGESFVRTTPYTGELLAQSVRVGDTVVSGAGVEDGSLLIRASADGTNRRLDRLVDLLEHAAATPPALQRQADRFVRVFLPIVLLSAGGAFAYWTTHVSLERGLFAGLAVLLVACPCAAGLATPLTLAVTLSRLARLGLIASSGDAIERLATARTVVFDKTGTLADENLSLRAVHWLPLPGGERAGALGETFVGECRDSAERSAANDATPRTALPPHLASPLRGEGPEALGREQVLAMIATLERGSDHPMAKLLRGLSDDAASFDLLRTRLLPARGVEGLVCDRATRRTHSIKIERLDNLAVASALAPSPGIPGEGWDEGSVSPHNVSTNNTNLHESNSEFIREGSCYSWTDSASEQNPHPTLSRNTGRGTEDAPSTEELICVVVSIDNHPFVAIDAGESLRSSAANCVARLSERELPVHIMTGDATSGSAASLAPSRTAMTPADKFHALRSLDRPLFVGDGVNDAPALATAHASIALANGSTLAVATASATLHGGDLAVIPKAIDLSRAAVRTIRSNLCFAIAYNLVGMTLAATGHLHPVVAAVLMGASSAIVSFRAFRETSDEQIARTIPSPALRVGFSPRTIKTVLAIGWMLQAVVLIPILDLPLIYALALLLAFALIAYGVSRLYEKLPDWLDMTLAMIAVGGAGMTLGWWIDLSFAPASSAMACCAAGVTHVPAMYLGMLALGTPAMYLLRRSRVVFSWRRWCCVAPLLIGIPGMVGGMWLGSVAAATISMTWPWRAATLLDFILMTTGMAVGMLLAHAMVDHADAD